MSLAQRKQSIPLEFDCAGCVQSGMAGFCRLFGAEIRYYRRFALRLR